MAEAASATQSTKSKQPKTVIRWGLFAFGPWRLCLAASERGLVYADRLGRPADRPAAKEAERSTGFSAGGEPGEPADLRDESDFRDEAERDLASWAARWIPDVRLERDEQALQPYAAQYDEYFRGERAAFTFPLDLRGTPFQREVWRALADIPFGETCAYSDIAERIGKPSAVRACGGAIGKNPVMIAVPCHRVIGKSGALTGFGGGLDLKAWLLAHENGKTAGQAR
jgi:methylated-DNA-[protein]-cysteine S-methyltransferase